MHRDGVLDRSRIERLAYAMWEIADFRTSFHIVTGVKRFMCWLISAEYRKECRRMMYGVVALVANVFRWRRHAFVR